MSKLVRRVLWIVSGVLILFIIFPLATRSRLEKMIKEKIRHEVAAEVEWTAIKAGWMRGFPNMSIRFFGLTILGESEFKGDTLVVADVAEIRVSPLQLLGREPKIHAIWLEHPVINGEMNKDGLRNWDIFRARENNGEPGDSNGHGKKDARADKGTGRVTGESSLIYRVKRFVIQHGALTFQDKPVSGEFVTTRFDLDLRTGTDADRKKIQLGLGMEELNASRKGFRYLKNGTLSMKLIANTDPGDGRYTILENQILLNGIEVETEGSFFLPGEGNGEAGLDLQFSSPRSSLSSLLSLVPAGYLAVTDTVRSAGEFRATGWIKGHLNDTVIPDAFLSLGVTDGFIAFRDQPLTASIQMAFEAMYNGTEKDSSWLDLKQLKVMLDDQPMEAKFLLTHPASDPVMKGMAAGIIDFGTLSGIIPLDRKFLSGVLKTDLQWDMRLSTLEEERFDEVKLDGILSLTDYVMESPEITDPVRVRNLNIMIDPENARLSALDMIIGASDMYITGNFRYLIPSLFKRHVLEGSLDVRSRALDIQALLPVDTLHAHSTGSSESSTGGLAVVASDQSSPLIAPPDTLAEPVRFTIPENVNIDMALYADRIRLPRMSASDLKGNLTVREGMVLIRNLSLEMLEGKVTMTGTIAKPDEFMEVDASIQVEQMDIPAAYRGLVSVKQLAPMAAYCSGKTNINMQYHSMVGNDFIPLYGTMEVNGRAQTRDLEIRNVDFAQVNSMVTNEKMRRMAPGALDIEFYIRQGRVGIEPLTIDFDESSVTVSGSHGIDHSLDYLVDLNIAKQDLGESARSMVGSLTFLAAAAGMKVAQSDHVNVKADITGTFEKPRIKTDLSGNMVPKNSTRGTQ